MELGASKGSHFRNIKAYKNGKVESLYCSTLPKIHIKSKISSNKRCSELNFVQKSQWMRMSISPRSMELRGSKDWHFWNIKMYKNGKVDSLLAPTLPKIHIMFKKMFQIKVVQNYISYKKVSGRICLSSSNLIRDRYLKQCKRFSHYW